MHDTEVGKSGFITALYIVFVPIISLFLGRRGSPLLWLLSRLSLVGLWFLCIPPEGFTIAAGDLFVLACAVVFSLHILVIGRYVLLGRRCRTLNDAVFLRFDLAFFAMLALESPTWIGWQTALPAMLWAGIMSNGIAYTLQIVGQRGMNDTTSSLILSLESVFTVISGWLHLNEVPLCAGRSGLRAHGRRCSARSTARQQKVTQEHDAYKSPSSYTFRHRMNFADGASS